MIVHDPGAHLDYGVDWSEWLAEGETITASTWVVPDGITESATEQPSFTGTHTTIWLTGGTANTSYRVVNHVTTSAGRQDERTIRIDVRDR